LSYSHLESQDLLYEARIRQLLQLKEVDEVNVGGALGWDTLAARAAFRQGVPFHLFVPFEGQESRWPKEAQKRYWQMRNSANKVTVVSEGGYSALKMQLRNEAMIDSGTDEVWAFWDGSNGGTKNCLAYAFTKKIPVINFHEKEDMSIMASWNKKQ
jgi:uncharacterized phage-like protein YoqJ